MKYTKAKALAKTGQYHFTFETLWKKLPKELIGKSTVKNLAIIIDLMYEQKRIWPYRGLARIIIISY